MIERASGGTLCVLEVTQLPISWMRTNFSFAQFNGIKNGIPVLDLCDLTVAVLGNTNLFIKNGETRL